LATTVDSAVLDEVFGPGEGDTPEDRAAGSSRVFVRSLSQLAEDSPAAMGRRLTAAEALDAYGLDVLREVASEGSALLCASPGAAGRLVAERRRLLQLAPRQVVNKAGVSPEALERLEAGHRVPVRQAERIARALGLDERTLSWKAEAPAENDRVAVRLRTIGEQDVRMTPQTVAAIAEASWVAATQLRLQHKLGIRPRPHGIEQSDDYGAPGWPAFRVGYRLAAEARQALGLGETDPLASLRELTENGLGIPLIQAEMGDGVAGATIAIGQHRAIILNLNGDNRSVFVRRSTVTHELGHLLFDPAGRLETLRVDEYEHIHGQHLGNDRIEQRANAFGVEFMAPQAAVIGVFDRAGTDQRQGLLDVINEFGISHTAASYQIWNGKERGIPIESLRLPPRQQPDRQRWEALEAYTIDYHPLERIKKSRAGKFSAVVLRAAQENLISWDTAAEMLECDEDTLRENEHTIKEMFPKVWPRSC
jgi:Zn-dependent peptidase ImmA (M78 family)/transcriptional regulator with XRE-family HTH domain